MSKHLRNTICLSLDSFTVLRMLGWGNGACRQYGTRLVRGIDGANGRQERVKVLHARKWLGDELISKILLRVGEEFLVVGNITADVGKWERD